MTNIVTEISNTFNSIGNFFTMANATIAALIIFTGYLISFSKKIKPYISVKDDIAALKVDLSKISSEFKTNGGKSLKDQINDLQVSTKTILYRQRWILDNREEPIFETDEHGNFTWVNDAFARLTDRPFRDLQNNNWINCLKEDSREEISESWKTAVENKRTFEHILFIVDSKNRVFSTKCIASRQEDGKYIGSFMSVEKVVEKKS
jgi:PAS domain S-box-containing protein